MTTIREWATANHVGDTLKDDAIRDLRVAGAVVNLCMPGVVTNPTRANIEDALDAVQDLRLALEQLRSHA